MQFAGNRVSVLSAVVGDVMADAFKRDLFNDALTQSGTVLARFLLSREGGRCGRFFFRCVA